MRKPKAYYHQITKFQSVVTLGKRKAINSLKI